jgi:hypothetical protein
VENTCKSVNVFCFNSKDCSFCVQIYWQQKDSSLPRQFFPVNAHDIFYLLRTTQKAEDTFQTHFDDAYREMANVHHQFERARRPKVCVRLHSLGKKVGQASGGRAAAGGPCGRCVGGCLATAGGGAVCVCGSIRDAARAAQACAHAPITLWVHCILSALLQQQRERIKIDPALANLCNRFAQKM